MPTSTKPSDGTAQAAVIRQYVCQPGQAEESAARNLRQNARLLRGIASFGNHGVGSRGVERDGVGQHGSDVQHAGVVFGRHVDGVRQVQRVLRYCFHWRNVSSWREAVRSKALSREIAHDLALERGPLG
eukprot:scaffold7027_cov376-Pinguiococcus_pyrenoidosus.AAC.1